MVEYGKYSNDLYELQVSDIGAGNEEGLGMAGVLTSRYPAVGVIYHTEVCRFRCSDISGSVFFFL